jgi:hypothetical protein
MDANQIMQTVTTIAIAFGLKVAGRSPCALLSHRSLLAGLL